MIVVFTLSQRVPRINPVHQLILDRKKRIKMKITKGILIKQMKSGLEKLGYMEFKDSILGTQGLFVKRLPNGLFISLGLIIHRYFENAYTGAFYLSKTTRWSSVWGDIPKESYKRPGHFLTISERSAYANSNVIEGDSPDIWWTNLDEKSKHDFIRVIEITEPRFVNQHNLIQKIEQSREIQALSEYSKKVREIVLQNGIDRKFNFKHIKEIDQTPVEWFYAAEVVLKEGNSTINHNIINVLATDSYRQFVLCG